MYQKIVEYEIGKGGLFMRTGFEEWLDEQELDIEADDLFRESIMCYKGSAYRAALLFSFLGFQTTLKYRIINSKAANGYEEVEWTQVKKELLNDDKWDRLLIDKIQTKKKPVFNVTEDLREQYTFCKSRSNDCAHAKGNTISYPHVEGFWLFIQSNLMKFVVNGGMKYILDEIRDHFNPARTPANTPIDPVIKQIPVAIEKVDFEEFLNQLKDFSLQQMKPSSNMLNKNIAEMWYKLFTLQGVYCDTLVDLLDKKPSFCVKIIRSNPVTVKYFYRKDVFIRILWKKDFSSPDDYRIFINLLRHNLIPSSQLNEAFDHIFESLRTTFFEEDIWWTEVEKGVSEMDEVILHKYGFFDSFNSLAFEDKKIVHDFNWGNRNKELIVYCIKHFGLNKDMITAINDSLTTSYPPFRLRKELENFYQDNPEQLDEHIKVSKDNSLNIPEALDELHLQVCGQE